MRMNGDQKLNVPYSARYSGLATKEWRSLMSRDIGSCIWSKVSMIAPLYLELPKEYRDISSYDIPPMDVNMCFFVVDKTEASIYKDWKYDCHNHYLNVFKATPQEFLARSEEWEYLKGHFEVPKFKAANLRNWGNRNKRKEKQINHHSGPLALSYRVEDHGKVWHPMLEVQQVIQVNATKAFLSVLSCSNCMNKNDSNCVSPVPEILLHGCLKSFIE